MHVEVFQGALLHIDGVPFSSRTATVHAFPSARSCTTCPIEGGLSSQRLLCFYRASLCLCTIISTFFQTSLLHILKFQSCYHFPLSSWGSNRFLDKMHGGVFCSCLSVSWKSEFLDETHEILRVISSLLLLYQVFLYHYNYHLLY